MVNTTRTETTLDDFETTARTKDHGILGHSDVLECNVTVTVRSIVVAEDGEHALDGDAGRVCGNDHHGLLLVHVLVVGV